MEVNSHVPTWIDEIQEVSTPSRKSGVYRAPWQELGVNPSLAHALNLRGFKNPTPIQRASLPHSLSKPCRDVLGMARTGSGKTLAYLIPLLQRLDVGYSADRGARALVLCPSRELALQIFRAGKDLGRRGGQSITEEKARLNWALIVGGETMDKQFEALTNKPDIIIATPGRFLHLVVEMNLDLKNLEMVVYDEADRLFEMGFDLQLREILHRLPTSRQSLLFSATLPVSVAEFVKGGLINPVLIRLDTESKISPNLSMAFFPVKPSEKEGALLVVLENILQVRSDRSDRKDPQAIIFVCTKHHVEYLTYLLELAGYLVAHIYGSLDQIARRQQLEKFRAGEKSLLIVTDVAARGLDIPVMDNVINYDFPSSPRVFVHRVGRTARAGHQGSAWTFVTRSEMPHLFELQTFLGSPLTAPDAGPFGTLPPHLIDNKTEYVYTSLAEAGPQLAVLREVMQRGQSRFDRSRTQASQQAYREAKAFSQRKEEHLLPIHSFFSVKMLGVDGGELSGLLSSIASFKPNETVFASRERGQTRGVHPMKARLVSRSRSLTQLNEQYKEGSDRSEKAYPHKSFQDPSFFMPHATVGQSEQKAYSLRCEDSFLTQVRAATFDVSNDEANTTRAQKPSQLKWDRKKKRFLPGDTVGADNKKVIRTESGAFLPASYRSGRFKTWQAQKRSSSFSDDIRQSSFGVRGGLDEKRSGGKGAVAKRSGSHGPSGRPKDSLLSAESIRKRRVQSQKV